MNDKGSKSGARAVPMNERLLVVSLGLLMNSMAHGVTDDGLGEDCRINSATDDRQLECAPIGARGGGVSDEDANLSQDLRSSETDSAAVETPSEQGDGKSDNSGGAKSVPKKDNTNAKAVKPAAKKSRPTSNEKSEEATVDGMTDEAAAARVERVAADGSAVDVESTTAAPNEDIELFKVDIESEEAEDELPPAVERDLFNLGGAAHRTSDDYDARSYSFSYRNHRREWFWPWQESAKRGIDVGVDVDRTSGSVRSTEFDALHAQGSLGGYLTKGTYLEAQFGRHNLDTDLGDRTITSHHVTAMAGLQHSFSIQLESARDFIYTGGSVTGGITRQLTAYDHSGSFRWRPDQRLRILGQGNFRKYDQENEENIARSADLSALYGISPDWPWIWAGLGASILKYEHQVADYWSPNRYTAYGLRFESSFPVYKRLSASAAVNLNRQSEDGVKGNGYDIKAGVQYRLYGHLYARFDVNKSKSIQQSSTWTSDNIFFTLSGPLF